MSESDEDMYVPYGERPEWADVTPLPQPESVNPGERDVCDHPEEGKTKPAKKT